MRQASEWLLSLPCVRLEGEEVAPLSSYDLHARKVNTSFAHNQLMVACARSRLQHTCSEPLVIDVLAFLV